MQTHLTKFFVAGATFGVVALTACGARAFATTTPPVGVAAAATPVAACTPTPVVRHPTFTIAPDQRVTPGALNTAIARYQATYPGDVHLPARTTDLEPQVAANNKQMVIVRHVDCTYEAYLMTGGKIAAFTSGLPSGDSVVTIGPPPILGVYPWIHTDSSTGANTRYRLWGGWQADYGDGSATRLDPAATGICTANCGSTLLRDTDRGQYASTQHEFAKNVNTNSIGEHREQLLLMEGVA